MDKHGFDPSDASTDRSTPQGSGNVAAAAVVAYRYHDGANQLGDEVGSNGVPYFDYTYYTPVNTSTKVNDPNRWQPIPFFNPKGGTIARAKPSPNFLLRTLRQRENESF